MSTLHWNWLTEGLIDFEYKKYTLLAYLKTVKESFARCELYPHLGELVFHYRQLKQLKESKVLFAQAFPKQLDLEKAKKLELVYEKIVSDDELMAELEAVVDYALPRFKKSLDDGSEIYDWVESHCSITPIGLMPLYKAEGYLFISFLPEHETKIYRYQVSIFNNEQEEWRGVHTRYIMNSPLNLTQRYETIKVDLTKTFTDLPNPAAYRVVSKLKYPETETIVPIAKRMLIKHVTNVEKA